MPFKAVLDETPGAEHMHIGLELDIGLDQDRSSLLNVTHFNVSLYNVDEWVFQGSSSWSSWFLLAFADGTGFSHKYLSVIPIAGDFLLTKWVRVDQPRRNWRAKCDGMLVPGLNRFQAIRLVIVKISLLHCDNLEDGEPSFREDDCVLLATGPSTYINVVD